VVVLMLTVAFLVPADVGLKTRLAVQIAPGNSVDMQLSKTISN